MTTQVCPCSEGTVENWGEGVEAGATSCSRGQGRRAGGAAALSCVWWSPRVPGANTCEKQIYFCLRFIFFTLRGGRQRISSSMES